MIDRAFVDQSGVQGLDSTTIHPLTRDERIAYDNLELLNSDMMLKTKPAP